MGSEMCIRDRSAEGTQDTETFEESRSWNEIMEQETTEVAGVNHADEEEGLLFVLLHVQAGILGKAVGSAIAPPYLLCRNRPALWLAWAILAIASRPFG